MDASKTIVKYVIDSLFVGRTTLSPAWASLSEETQRTIIDELVLLTSGNLPKPCRCYCVKEESSSRPDAWHFNF